MTLNIIIFQYERGVIGMRVWGIEVEGMSKYFLGLQVSFKI